MPVKHAGREPQPVAVTGNSVIPGARASLLGRLPYCKGTLRSAQMSSSPLQSVKLQSRENEQAFIRKALRAAISDKIIASVLLRPRKMYCCLCVKTAAQLGFSVSSRGDVGGKGTASTENYMDFLNKCFKV